jgi:hypothetical protein
MSNNKQTTVEWLQETLESFGNKHGLQVSWVTVDELFERAEARHKKELISFALKYATLVIAQRTVVNAEEVYNETYGGK